jgi:hypothetical protein
LAKSASMVSKAFWHSGVRSSFFLHTWAVSGVRWCDCHGNMSRQNVTAPTNDCDFLTVCGACMLRTASIFLCHGFRPVGVSQHPNQSVSWTAHSHLSGSMVKLAHWKLLALFSSWWDGQSKNWRRANADICFV